MTKWWRGYGRVGAGLGLITLAGLLLRLLAWRWHEFRPLGGDEREYLDLALHLAQGRGYYDLQFMRPPLFPVGLAALVWLFDGDLQLLRLANLLISTATIPLMFWWTRSLLGADRPPLVPLLAAALTALSYTLALNATELLTEAVTLAGLTLAFSGVLAAGRRPGWRWAALAGVAIALVCLVRSVALPLLPLGALWLWRSGGWRPAGVLVLAAFLTIAPWTLRNAITYGGFILIDTTGPENLWLDNDPAGREAVKAQLYALGDQRVARSELASARGIAALTESPGWVLGKSWREFRRFWALEHTDDMLARPAIWVPPSEVWLRLILGDGLWLLVLLAGVGGLLLLPVGRWLRAGLGLWVLYTVLTGALFHVEYRYRLPLLPALLPSAAWLLAAVWGWWRGGRARSRLARLPVAAAGLLMLTLLGLTFTFRPYASEALRLGHKHWLLAQAEAALAGWDGQTLAPELAQTGRGIGIYQAQVQAAQALQLDPRSVLARALLARVDLALGQPERARGQLDAAIAQLPAHPYAHLLRGDLLRAQSDRATARRDLAFETASGEDLQAWARARLTQTPLTTTLDLGGGLDLGFIGGFHAAEDDGTRWSKNAARLLLAPSATASSLVLRVAAQRPAGVVAPEVAVAINGVSAGTFAVADEWGAISIPLPAGLDRAAPLTVDLRPTSTFVPHASDRANPDGRDLGIRLDWAELR